MEILFWGVRGSIPSPGSRTIQYGGNTSSVSVTLDDGRLVLFDAGTGIRECGNWLMSRGGAISATICISHTHWDHIQGFPFFVPSYVAGNEFTVCGPPSDAQPMGIQRIMEMQTAYEFFPVKVGELGSRIAYLDVTGGRLDLDGLEIEACLLNHPVPCYAYRITSKGKTYVYGGDHEPYRNPLRDDAQAAAQAGPDRVRELDEEAQRQNDRIAAFLEGADMVSWDSTYTEVEYANRRGWGHSWYEANLDLAEKAGVGRMFFTHHDPSADDECLALREEIYGEIAEGRDLDVAFAREGMSVEL